MEQMKTCKKCGKELPATTEYFYKQATNKSGLYSTCKICKKKYREANSEHISNYGKIHHEKNKEYIAAYKREYKLLNREIFIREKQKRRSQKRNLESSLTLGQWEIIKEHFDGKCAYCGKKLPLAQEHFIPLSKGGEYTKNNITPSCKSCNSSKSNKNFFDWYPKYRHYSKKREKKILEFLNYKDGVQQLTMVV